MTGPLVNLVIAVAWTLLAAPAGAGGFLVGWIFGFGLIALGQRVLRCEEYVRRSVALFRFILAFTWQFLAATGGVVRVVLTQSRARLHPDYVDYDIRGLHTHEVVLIGFLATLTPGTSAVRIDDERHLLILHALDARQPDEVRAWLDRHLRDRILAFTR